MRKIILMGVFALSVGILPSLHAQTEQQGKASFYANKFDGRKTANGEKFSNKMLTAAHRSLPFGTLIEVTNLINNKSVIVRVNDRGPFAKKRVLDLSRVAAEELDFIKKGFTKVRIRVVAAKNELCQEIEKAILPKQEQETK